VAKRRPASALVFGESQLQQPDVDLRRTGRSRGPMH
jgi:hypothetical protein